MISPLPGVTATTPGSATRPFFGIKPEVVKKDGTPAKPNEGGYLIIGNHESLPEGHEDLLYVEKCVYRKRD
jgi:acyl-coenzyme A synthetase/AMP-(fatty) acid ligase